MVCLATAHPCKFPDAVVRATGKEPEKPEAIRSLEGKERRVAVLPHDPEKLKRFLQEQAI
jgi:threonine synthase